MRRLFTSILLMASLIFFASLSKIYGFQGEEAGKSKRPPANFPASGPSAPSKTPSNKPGTRESKPTKASERQPGSLSVIPSISGAQIEISNGGSYSSYTNQVSELELPPGTYAVTVSEPGYQTNTREVKIKSGEALKLSISLKPMPVEEPPAVELGFWNTVKNSNNEADFRAYLEKYPNGQFATLANNRINTIAESATPAEPTPSHDASATELAFWDSIKNSPNHEDFRLYMKKYPSGAFVELANARLSRFEQDAKEAEQKDKILKELLNVEQQGFEAFQRGNKAAFSAMAAEEFTLVADGQSYNKEQVLSLVKPQKILLILSFESVSLNLKGEIAVLEGIAVYRPQNATKMGILRQKFTDYFAKRNGRWLVLKSEETTLK